MKKLIAGIASIAMLLMVALPVLAVKPTTNLAAAKQVPWNLSGTVMPFPWGQHDIIGSELSKLIVNQPNGDTQVTITGAMKGLEPNTQYTVYISNAWLPTVTSWNVSGSYVIDLTWEGNHYTEYLVLSQTDTSITGISLALAGNASPWTIDGGSVTGNTVNIHAYFNSNPAMHITMTATIANDGSMTGSWQDEAPGTRNGGWSTTSGAANWYIASGGYPELFNSLSTFTFITDEFGAGSWHINLTDANFPGITGTTYPLSVWINSPYPATILISDNFTVVKKIITFWP